MSSSASGGDARLLGRVAIFLRHEAEALVGSGSSPAAAAAALDQLCADIGAEPLDGAPPSRALAVLSAVSRRDRRVVLRAVPIPGHAHLAVVTVALAPPDADDVDILVEPALRPSEAARKLLWHMRRYEARVADAPANAPDRAVAPAMRDALRGAVPSACGFLGCEDACVADNNVDRTRFKLDRVFARCRSPAVPPPPNTLGRLGMFHSLPDEALELVSRHLTPREFTAFAGTCQGMRRVLAPFVPGLKLRLYPHQAAALWRMLERERDPRPNVRLPHVYDLPFLDEAADPESHAAQTCHVDMATGAVMEGPAQPTVADCRGGLFCDEPGLGKTITALAIILRTLGQQAKPPPGVSREEVYEEPDSVDISSPARIANSVRQAGVSGGRVNGQADEARCSMTAAERRRVRTLIRAKALAKRRRVTFNIASEGGHPQRSASAHAERRENRCLLRVYLRSPDKRVQGSPGGPGIFSSPHGVHMREKSHRRVSGVPVRTADCEGQLAWSTYGLRGGNMDAGDSYRRRGDKNASIFRDIIEREEGNAKRRKLSGGAAVEGAERIGTIPPYPIGRKERRSGPAVVSHVGLDARRTSVPYSKALSGRGSGTPSAPALQIPAMMSTDASSTGEPSSPPEAGPSRDPAPSCAQRVAISSLLSPTLKFIGADPCVSRALAAPAMDAARTSTSLPLCNGSADLAPYDSEAPRNSHTAGRVVSQARKPNCHGSGGGILGAHEQTFLAGEGYGANAPAQPLGVKLCSPAKISGSFPFAGSGQKFSEISRPPVENGVGFPNGLFGTPFAFGSRGYCGSRRKEVPVNTQPFRAKPLWRKDTVAPLSADDVPRSSGCGRDVGSSESGPAPPIDNTRYPDADTSAVDASESDYRGGCKLASGSRDQSPVALSVGPTDKGVTDCPASVDVASMPAASSTAALHQSRAVRHAGKAMSSFESPKGLSVNEGREGQPQVVGSSFPRPYQAHVGVAPKVARCSSGPTWNRSSVSVVSPASVAIANSCASAGHASSFHELVGPEGAVAEGVRSLSPFSEEIGPSSSRRRPLCGNLPEASGSPLLRDSAMGNGSSRGPSLCDPIASVNGAGSTATPAVEGRSFCASLDSPQVVDPSSAPSAPSVLAAHAVDGASRRLQKGCDFGSHEISTSDTAAKRSPVEGPVTSTGGREMPGQRMSGPSVGDGISVSKEPKRGLRRLYYRPTQVGRYLPFGFEDVQSRHGNARGATRRSVKAPDFLAPGVGKGCLPMIGVRDVSIYLSGATLVVVPPVLVSHWSQQIYEHVEDGLLRVLTVKSAAEIPPAVKLAFDYDVVIMSFRVLNAVYLAMREEAPSLLCVRFLRVIMDEGHKLGSSRTGLSRFSRVCESLKAERRWIMTGTPTPSTPSTDVRHVQPLLQFIRDDAYGRHDKEAWTRGIQRPYETYQVEALERLDDLFSRVMIRSCKADLKNLPKCVVKNVILDFTTDSAESYNELVLLARRNLILCDWYDENHAESLLNHRNAGACNEYLGNMRSACCFGGFIRSSVDLTDLGETLSLLYRCAMRAKVGMLSRVRQCDMHLHIPSRAKWWASPEYAPSEMTVASGMPLSQAAQEALRAKETLQEAARDAETQAPQGLNDASPGDEQNGTRSGIPCLSVVEHPQSSKDRDSDGTTDDGVGGSGSGSAESSVARQASGNAPAVSVSGSHRTTHPLGEAKGSSSSSSNEEDEGPFVLPRMNSRPGCDSRLEFKGVLKEIGLKLMQGCHCSACDTYTRLPILSTCGHTVCLDCFGMNKYGCVVPSCGHEYALDDKGIPEEVIELQPSIHNSNWQPTWENSESAKITYLLKRLGEIEDRVVWEDGAWRKKRPKVIIFSQFHMHHLLLQYTFQKSERYRNSYVELFQNEKELDDSVRHRGETADAQLVRLLRGFIFNPAKHILLLEAVHGSVGLDLSFVEYIFLLEPVWDSSLEKQVIARAHRLGAKETVHVERLAMRGSVEEAMMHGKAGEQSGVGSQKKEVEFARRAELLKSVSFVRAGGAEPSVTVVDECDEESLSIDKDSPDEVSVVEVEKGEGAPLADVPNVVSLHLSSPSSAPPLTRGAAVPVEMSRCQREVDSSKRRFRSDAASAGSARSGSIFAIDSVGQAKARRSGSRRVRF